MRLSNIVILLGGLFFVLAWLLPNHYAPWPAAYQDLLSFGALAFLLLACMGRRSFFIVPSLGVFFILPLIPLAQFFSGVLFFAGDAWIASAYLFGFAMALVAGYNLSQQAEGQRIFFFRIIAGALIVGAVVSVWIAVRQWLMLPGSLWVADLNMGQRPYGNLAQPNNLATLLCLGLAGTFYLYEKYIVGRLAASLLTILLLFGVALTQSRTPWLGAMAVVAFWVCVGARVPRRLSVLQLLGCVAVYALLVVLLPSIAKALLISEELVVRAGTSSRIDMWRQLFHAMANGPLWGYGWNQVSVAQVGVSLEYVVPMPTEHSHNLLLDLLVWNGPVLGSVIIFYALSWLFLVYWRARSVESLFALIAAGLIIVHGMLEYPLEYAFFLLPTGIFLGIAVAEQGRGVQVFVLPRLFLGLIILAGSGLLVCVGKEYLILESSYRQMRFERARLADATSVHLTPEVVVISQLREYMRFARTQPDANMTVDDIEWMRRVAYRYPYPSSLFRYALALGLNGQPVAAREQLRIIKALHGDGYAQEGIQVLHAMAVHHPQLNAVLSEPL